MLPIWLALVLAVAAGAFMTTQARINGQLALELGDRFVAASLSFGLGFLVLCIVLLAFPRGRRGFTAIRQEIAARSIPWWFTLAGSAGAGYVLSQAMVVGVTGVALFTVAVVAGLTIGSVLLDLWGVGPAGKRPLTSRRIIGAVLGLIAVVVGVLGQPVQTNGIYLLIMPLLFGVAVAWQQASNGRMTMIAGTPWTSTFLNFGVGTGILLIATAIHALQAGLPIHFPPEWWLYLGGPVGIVFIAANAVVVRALGVLVLSLGTMAGQLVMAVVFDVVSPAGHPLVGSTLWGTALIFIAVIVASLPAKRRS